jgi:hypothetical protein
MTTCNIGTLQQVTACSINSFDFSVRKRPTLGISRAVLLELPRNRSEPVAFINSFDFRILAYKLQTLRDDCCPTQFIYYSCHFNTSHIVFITEQIPHELFMCGEFLP